MNLIGDQIREVQELESALVGDNGVGACERESACDHVTVGGRGKAPHPVDAMPQTFKRAAPSGVVGQRGARDASLHGLVCGQEPALALDDLVQPIHHRTVTRINEVLVGIRDGATAWRESGANLDSPHHNGAEGGFESRRSRY